MLNLGHGVGWADTSSSHQDEVGFIPYSVAQPRKGIADLVEMLHAWALISAPYDKARVETR